MCILIGTLAAGLSECLIYRTVNISQQWRWSASITNEDMRSHCERYIHDASGIFVSFKC